MARAVARTWRKSPCGNVPNTRIPASSRRSASRTGSGHNSPAQDSGRQLDPEGLAEPALAVVGDQHRARVAQAGDPAELEAAGCKGGPDGSRQMGAALTPIETRPAEGAARATPLANLDAKGDEKLLAARRDHAAIYGQPNVLPLHQCICQCHTKPPGEMIVADAGVPQRVAATPARLAARRTG